MGRPTHPTTNIELFLTENCSFRLVKGQGKAEGQMMDRWSGECQVNVRDSHVNARWTPGEFQVDDRWSSGEVENLLNLNLSLTLVDVKLLQNYVGFVYRVFFFAMLTSFSIPSLQVCLTIIHLPKSQAQSPETSQA